MSVQRGYPWFSNALRVLESMEADGGGHQAGGRTLRLTFFGVRGSCPCAGPQYVRYGGNTACVSVEIGDEPPIVIDLGTGLRPFGIDIAARYGPDKPLKVTALLTHLHWDHIIGLPFCSPLLRAGAQIDVFGPHQQGGSLHDTLAAVVQPPFFPVPMKDLEGHFVFHEVADDEFAIGSAKVKVRVVPHVGTTLGFRIDANGRSMAFISDHQAPEDRQTVDQNVLELCDGVDVLMHDAQYTEEEYQTRATWGHSTISYAVHVAAEAGARQLVMFHHDPLHTDDDIDRLLELARSDPEAARLDGVVAAAEGMSLDLDGR